MKGTRRFRDYLKERLKNEEFRKGYEQEGIYAEVALQVAHLRAQKKISQKRLAEMLHTSQQMISRLEDPENSSYSLKTLEKLARAFGKKLRIQFV